MFFGFDHPDVDYLYRDELAEWERAGIVDVRTAFANEVERTSSRYVADVFA